MLPPLLDVNVAGGLALLAILAFVLGVRNGLRRGDSDRLQRLAGLEAAALAVLGGLMARTFVIAMLALAGPTAHAAMGIGGAFLAWPALLDLAGWTLGHGQVSSPTFVAGLATLVGAFAGLCDGLGQVFDFRRRGAGEFLLDVTWGLPGTSLAMLVHLSNFGWGQPVCVGRPGAHRYRSGFRLKGRFAVTLGSACSNLGEHWDQPLFEHERVHVAQNRRFGPFYTWTYAAWFMLLLPFAIAAGLRRGNLEAAAMEYCYYNNPWEEWAYRVGGWRPDEVVWPPQEQAPRYAAFFLGCGAAAAWLATRL